MNSDWAPERQKLIWPHLVNVTLCIATFFLGPQGPLLVPSMRTLSASAAILQGIFLLFLLHLLFKPTPKFSHADFLLLNRKLFLPSKNPVSASAMLTGKFCESGMFLQHAHYWLKNFWIIWKMSECYTKYPNKSVRMIWKVSGQSKKCLDNLENVSGSSGKCPDDLESFLTI